MADPEGRGAAFAVAERVRSDIAATASVNHPIMRRFSEMRSATFRSAFMQGVMNTALRIEDAIDGAAAALNRIGGHARCMDRPISFNDAIMDAQEAGRGALIDADPAKEAALLRAIEIRRRLAAQAFGIANQAPPVRLSPFR